MVFLHSANAAMAMATRPPTAFTTTPWEAPEVVDCEEGEADVEDDDPEDADDAFDDVDEPDE